MPVPSVLDQRRNHLPSQRGGDGEGDVLAAAGVDDAEHRPVEVHQRAAAVTRVDGGVGLYPFGIR